MSTETNGSALATIIATLAEAEPWASATLETNGTRYVCSIEDDDINGAEYINGFDCYGRVEYVRDRHDSRPDGFTGAARKLTTYHGDRYWWEPYREGHKVYATTDDQAQVLALLNGEGPYGVVVTQFDVETCQCCDHTEVSERDTAALWGIDSLENGYKAEVISELLAELGVTE